MTLPGRGLGIMGALRRRIMLAVVVLAAMTPALTGTAQDLTGDLSIHDPSAVMIENGQYHVFSTGYGISSKVSSDRIDWQDDWGVFGSRNIPSWTYDIPGFKGNFWAPDIAYFNGLYHLYYSVSTPGSRNSAIGLATNPTLDRSNPADSGRGLQQRQRGRRGRLHHVARRAGDRLHAGGLRPLEAPLW